MFMGRRSMPLFHQVDAQSRRRRREGEIADQSTGACREKHGAKERIGVTASLMEPDQQQSSQREVETEVQHSKR
jgi:hypothetical protein